MVLAGKAVSLINREKTGKQLRSPMIAEGRSLSASLFIRYHAILGKRTDYLLITSYLTPKKYFENNNLNNRVSTMFPF